MSGSEGRNPIEDYKIIREELDSYSDKLQNKKEIIVANKKDLPGFTDNLQLFKDLMNIKGIGCKFSFYISSNNVNAVKMAIKNKDIEYLSSIPHIGEKMALKIISAYKPKKIDNIDLIETLLTLGYLKKDIYEILDKIDPNDNLNEQIKQSLKLLSERKWNE